MARLLRSMDPMGTETGGYYYHNSQGVVSGAEDDHVIRITSCVLIYISIHSL